MIELRDLTRANWRACAALELPVSQQGLVAPNVFSIAELHFEPHYVPRVICLEEQVVGFLMYCPETEPPDPTLYWLFRLMVAPAWQGKGYGMAAIRLAVAEIRARGATRIRTMHRPSNVRASHLYVKAGFTEMGLRDDGDMELEMRLESQ